MSAGKIVLLIIYAVLAGLAITQPATSAGIWSLRILVVLVVAHAVEVAIFFKACQRAGGSLPGHLVSVFLFGVLHMKELKAAQTGG
jgi:uncharacterized protein YhhL (DUF1145 family)